MRGLMAVTKSLTSMSRMNQEELKELFGLSSLPASYKDIDPDKLPDETLEEFSYEGLDFEEAATQLWNHLTIMHYHAGSYNRQSDWFPLACAQLEKDIRIAGSFCLTKTVLEAQGREFPGLEHMNLQELYGLTCYYFRKCGRAFDDIYTKAGLISVSMHKWELRWLELGGRLKATEEKCQKIREGKLSVESILKRAEMYTDKSRTDKPKSAREAKPLVVMQSALPLIGSYARQVRQERKEEARIRRLNEKIHRDKERLDRFMARAEAEDQKILREIKKIDEEKAAKEKARKADTPAPKTSPEKQEEMSPMELRKKLINMAEQRGEGADIIQIVGDPPERLWDRWRRYQKEDELQKMRSHSGTANHPRKPLRKKQKKR